MTSQAIPRGHHPGPRKGEVLDTEPKLGAPCGFQFQDKTQWETKVLTSVLVREGSLGPRVPVNWRVQKPHHRREALLIELVLNPGSGSDHWFICGDPVLKLCQ
jgi:hypothetical protein